MFRTEHQVERSWLGDVRKRVRSKIHTLLYVTAGPAEFIIHARHGVHSCTSSARSIRSELIGCGGYALVHGAGEPCGERLSMPVASCG